MTMLPPPAEIIEHANLSRAEGSGATKPYKEGRNLYAWILTTGNSFLIHAH